MRPLLVLLLSSSSLGWSFQQVVVSRWKTARLFAEREAMMGLGCFWEPSEKLEKVPGVIRARVGYAGGQDSPTYGSVKKGDGNVETVKVVYDDDILTYEALLTAAMKCAKPMASVRQYSPVIFCKSDDEVRRAEAWREGQGASDFSVERATNFWIAEQYHQNYWAKCVFFVIIRRTFYQVAAALRPSDGLRRAPVLARHGQLASHDSHRPRLDHQPYRPIRHRREVHRSKGSSRRRSQKSLIILLSIISSNDSFFYKKIKGAYYFSM